MGATDGRSIKTDTRIRNKRNKDGVLLPHHDQQPHPAGLKFTKRRKLRRLNKSRA